MTSSTPRRMRTRRRNKEERRMGSPEGREKGKGLWSAAGGEAAGARGAPGGEGGRGAGKVGGVGGLGAVLGWGTGQNQSGVQPPHSIVFLGARQEMKRRQRGGRSGGKEPRTRRSCVPGRWCAPRSGAATAQPATSAPSRA